MRIKASNSEWLALTIGLLLIVIGGIYSSWRIRIIHQLLAQDRSYIQARDKEWKEQRTLFIDKMQSLQETILSNQKIFLDYIEKNKGLK